MGERPSDDRFRFALEQFHRFESNFQRISAALDFSISAHEGQRRLSGSPYIIGQVLVAKTLRERGASVDCIVSGLVHDILEDTEHTREQLEQIVGSNVIEIVTAVSQMPFGRSLSLSDGDRIRRVARLFELSGVADLAVCTRIVDLNTAVHALPQPRREAIIRETQSIMLPALKAVGIQELADELRQALETGPVAHEASLDDLVQSLVPHDFGKFTRGVADAASRAGIDTTVQAAVVLERLNRFEAILREASAPSFKDLLGDAAFIDLKGVWIWAEYLIGRGRRSQKAADGIARQADAEVEAMDKTTGGITDCLVASATTSAEPEKLHWIARMIRKLKKR